VKKYISIACLLAALPLRGVDRGENVDGACAMAAPQHVLILGFMGGRNHRDDVRFGVGRFAKKLRDMDLPCVQVATFENTKRKQALQMVERAFGPGGDGQIETEERASRRLIVYGQSFGGAAVVKFARQLKATGIPILLTVQVDAVGLDDQVIPSNVAAAASLFQRNGVFIHGPRHIKAEDPRATKILGDFQFNYHDSAIDISDLAWHQKLFRESHTRMDRDPAVWNKVEDLILKALACGGQCATH